MLTEKHKSQCKQGAWGRQVVELRSSQKMAGLELTLRMSGRSLLVCRQLRCLLEAVPLGQWERLGRGYLRAKSCIKEGTRVLRKICSAFSEMQTLLGSLGNKKEVSVPDFNGRLRDWEDWLATREGVCEVEVMEEMLELLVKAFRQLVVIDGLEGVVPCLLQYFGEEWASMGQLPPSPPLSSPSSLLSRRSSGYHSAGHRGGVEIAGVKNLATRMAESEKCGEKGQLCKEGEEKKLLEVVLAHEVETIVDATESDDDDDNKIFSFELDFPPLAASTPLASLDGLYVDLSSGNEDTSSSGSDWLLDNHE